MNCKLLVIGDWGWGIGHWAQSPIPNPQSPIPNPQSPIEKLKNLKLSEIKIYKINLFIIILLNFI